MRQTLFLVCNSLETGKEPQKSASDPGIGLNVLNSRPTTSLAQLMQGPSDALTLEKTAVILMTKFEVLWEEFLVNRGTFAPFRNLYLERWLHS